MTMTIRSTFHRFDRAFPLRHALSLSLLVGVTGCQSIPAEPVNAPQAAADAIGLAAPIELRIVGPDGGPLDEPEPTTASLSMAEALRRAVTNDPSLQAALARVRMAMADADQARLLPNPVLNVVLRWGPGTPQIEASLAQDLVQALQIPRRASAADHRLREAASDAVTVAIDVVSEVQERYIEAQAADALTPLLVERMALLERLAAVARARLEAGEGTRSDLATLDAQRVELAVEIDQSDLAARDARLRLARLVGQPSSAATWALDDWSAAGHGTAAELPPESRYIDAALAKRPEILAIGWRLRALGDDEALARLLPWDGAEAGVDASRDDSLFVGPSISTPLPVFDMGQARQERAAAESLEARHELTTMRRTVVEEVRRAYQTMQASAANLRRIRDELIPLQERRCILAEDAYRAGQSDVTALFLAEQDLRLAQAKAVEVERQAATAEVRLSRAVGGPGVASTLTDAARPADAAH